mgnify:CR=1 FL=1
MEEKDRRLFRLLGSLSTVGITLVATTVIGYYLGKYLDGFFGSSPWLTILFLLFGIAAGFKNLYDQTKKIQDLDDAPDRKTHDR